MRTRRSASAPRRSRVAARSTRVSGAAARNTRVSLFRVIFSAIGAGGVYVRGMRRIALCACAALALAAMTATAFAQSTVDIDSHVTPVVRKFEPKTTPSTLAVNLTFHGPNGEAADTLQSVILKFTYGAKLNGALFPSCSADDIRNHKPCPKGS